MAHPCVGDRTFGVGLLVVDTGLLPIVVGSLAVGQPFTLQYAREVTSSEVWSSPAFMAVNRTIPGV